MVKKGKKVVSFDEKIKAAKYERIYQALKDVLKVEIKTTSTGGKDEIDYAATCIAIKTKARLAIEFVADLDADNDEN